MSQTGPDQDQWKFEGLGVLEDSSDLDLNKWVSSPFSKFIFISSHTLEITSEFTISRIIKNETTIQYEIQLYTGS